MIKMFNYVNYNAIVAALSILVFINGMFFRVSDAIAAAADEVRAKMAEIHFCYDVNSKAYSFHTIGEPVAGSQVKVVYEAARREAIFKNSETVYMRYSYDFWKTCSDVQLKKDKKGNMSAVVTMPENASTLQTAFFAAYSQGDYSKNDYKPWGWIWDSDFGRNFGFNLVTRKDLAQLEMFEKLNATK